MHKYTVWFFEVDKQDLALVGGKGANLGEMTKIGIPVPSGFIVTSTAYYHFLEASALKKELSEVLSKLDVSDSKALQKAAKKCQEIIEYAPIPKDIQSEIIKSYMRLGKIFFEPYVAVRSSATAEDLPTASFAGQQATFLNIKGEANLVHHVRLCWASLFTARAIFYRTENKFNHFKVGIAVPVQLMVQSEMSGIMFTVNPVTNEKQAIVIEAIYGLGELIVQGSVTPDHYEVDKNSLEITQKKSLPQTKLMHLFKGKTLIDTVAKEKQNSQKITDTQIKKLAYFGKLLEHHYYFPQDIEWAIEKNKIYITQTRPITTLKSRQVEKVDEVERVEETVREKKLLVKGDPASPGIACGPVKIIRKPSEIDKIVSGDVLVAPQTNPDFVPAMRRAVAIVTETGGRTSHAAIVSRELGIPAVVGAKDALKILKTGQVVTVFGNKGEIYQGGIDKSSLNKKMTFTTNKVTHHKNKLLKTATRVYVNLADPTQAHKVAQKNVDGVGLLRAEFMIAGIGIHPKLFIKEKKQHLFVETLSQKLISFCDAFYPRTVVYRATDFRTNEYRNLKGGKLFEPVEANPMLGFRGAFRYLSDPKVFELEIDAIKNVRNKYGYKNLSLMIPFVHTPHELQEVKKIMAGRNLMRSSTFKLWMMVEIPSNVILLDDFLAQGIDGVSIGSNDLTMLTLGIDRDNSEVAKVFDERNPAVLWSLERVIKICQKHKVTSSICGQAPSDYPELVEKLVEWGITSISVNQDVVDQVRETIYEAEKKLVSKR